MNTKIAAALLVGGLSMASVGHAELQSRLDGQAYYDTELDITWLADTNYSDTSGYDPGGKMTWDEAKSWVSSLNVGGKTGWRLANIDVNGDGVVVNCATVTKEECRDNEYGYMFRHNGIKARAIALQISEFYVQEL